ncbi:MAG: ferredoxin reductase [Burkholderiales bacterium]|nr:ferredoxin reductase [Burkholderiales bacterium]
MHESFAIGLRLRCGPPRSDFALHEDARPAVLIAGGIGITPIKAMAHALEARGAAAPLHYAVRSGAEAAYRDELARELGARLHLYSSADGRRMDIAALLTAAPPEALFYACGPHRLLDAVARCAGKAGIDPARVRVERFAASIAPDAGPIEVALRRSGRTLQVARDQTILDAALAAGVEGALRLPRRHLRHLRGRGPRRRARPSGPRALAGRARTRAPDVPLHLARHGRAAGARSVTTRGRPSPAVHALRGVRAASRAGAGAPCAIPEHLELAMRGRSDRLTDWAPRGSRAASGERD